MSRSTEKTKPYMILVLDAGNSNIDIGCIENGEVLCVDRMETNRRKTESEYAVTMESILRLNGKAPSDFEGAVISSVVPPLTDTLRLAVKRLTGLDAIVVGPGIETGLNIGLDAPDTMGADLVAAAVAAQAAYPMPCVLFDMGTATTVSVMDKTGKFLGGAVMPGLGISMDALSNVTAQLPHISLDPPKKCISSNTVDCMKSGAVFGYASAVDGMLDRIQEELGTPVTAVATGGLAPKVVPWCRHRVELDSGLLLKGLWLIWIKNKPQHTPK